MPPSHLIEEDLTGAVIGAFYTVYNTLGYGFFEDVYVNALEYELKSRGHTVAREVSVIIWYRGTAIACQRLEMIVDGKLVVEAKATETLPPVASRQVYSYLKASDLRVGLVLPFGPQPSFFRLIDGGPKKRGGAGPTESDASDQSAESD